MNQHPFHGLVAAPFTPFTAAGAVAYERIPAYARYLRDQGIHCAFICGTTGEGASLSSAERRKTAETWQEHRPDDLRLIVHVGHSSLTEARELAAHADSLGVAAISAAAPSFFKPGSAADLVASCQEIAAAAPNTPFYYYHIPSMTGVSIPCLDFLKLAHDRIPTLRGIKFTYEDLMDYLACLEFADGRYDIVFGRDESLAAAHAIGARGAIGSTYNYLAPIFTRLLEAADRKDLDAARHLQREANDIIAVMARHGGLPAAKAIMKLIGLDLGPVRLPLSQPPAEALDALARDLAQTRLFAYQQTALAKP
ncbi:MAG: dihydrodipicolinate synthase family protein [Verrucomicrobiales bacterium]